MARLRLQCVRDGCSRRAKEPARAARRCVRGERDWGRGHERAPSCPVWLDRPGCGLFVVAPSRAGGRRPQRGDQRTFASGASANINGRLQASGTPDAAIVLTSDRDDAFGGDFNLDRYGSVPQRGDWGPLYFSNTSSDNRLEHVFIRYGGRTGRTIDTRAPLTIRNAFITGSSQDGVFSSNTDVLMEDTFSTSPTVMGASSTARLIRRRAARIIPTICPGSRLSRRRRRSRFDPASS